ncbi:Na/Pi cotransporter family protein [Parablautia muri]|uniref:Na/Pi cotransporter family protein n=1 Tax=Parablautia muri TaxID=2320879 RepID=A0A9X5GTL4_9FIRM|nr:Na/Pi cotransporter family protein [Parablautia muri]NBJ93910.1 Na/Pi cotransporter family protein [Parablautia muri]
MDIFDVLTLIGGLSLFLFGMNIMGQSLERRAGGNLRLLLGKLTTNKAAGLLTGLGVTAVIQSSSATTVMVVGFVNSGLMTLKQAINVIMGANIGTTVTAWVLSLAGIESGNVFVSLLKPSSFTPVLALIGIIFYMFCRNDEKKDTGMILLGFATLMFGMETMSGAVSGLRSVPWFQSLFIMFQNPILGVLAGAILTAVIQSSSASVGILQALAVTGRVSYGAAIPIIMGQNIGTCVTAMISSVGANKNAKRAAMVHLSFNVIGTVVWITVFCLIKVFFSLTLLEEPASLFGIAVAHSVFNLLCTVLILPLSGFFERLVNRLVPDAKQPEVHSELDERLLSTPAIALERCHKVAADMAQIAVDALKESVAYLLHNDSLEMAGSVCKNIREREEKTDYYEDILGTYLVKLSAKQISRADSAEAAKLLKMIGDFERISDHAVNILESEEEMQEKGLAFTADAVFELQVIGGAVNEILDLSLTAFLYDDLEAASKVEPLEQVIDQLKEQMRTRHILRMQQGLCSIDVGFIWSDLLTNLERTADHCSNIAGCVIDMAHQNMNIHESLRSIRNDSEDFQQKYRAYASKYSFVR